MSIRNFVISNQANARRTIHSSFSYFQVRDNARKSLASSTIVTYACIASFRIVAIFFPRNKFFSRKLRERVDEIF